MNRITSTLLFVLCSICMFSQNQSVSGTVTDIFGDPLPGIDVVIKGTVKGASTDFDGKYSINNVSPSDVLVISSIGYTTQEIPVGDKTVIDVNLEESEETLEEVVVIGYGTAKKSELTGSISSIKGADIVAETVSTSIDQGLQGRAAGVNITLNSGAPGASSSINIRGISSINLTAQPIFVIDGVIISNESGNNFSNPLNSINPNDIESIDILKDASATAIYGSRASNGVIIITTKRGREGRLNISYDNFIGFQEIPKKLDVLNLQEYATHKNTRADFGLITRDPNFINPSLLGEGTDWQDEIFRKAFMQSHYLSASGGGEKTTFALGAGYLNQAGIAIGSEFERLSVRAVIDSKISDIVKVGTTLNVNNINRDDAFTTIYGTGTRAITTALRQTPNISVRNPDGTFAGTVDDFGLTNPLAMALINENKYQSFDVRTNSYLELSLLKDDLKLKTSYSANLANGNRYIFRPSFNFSELDATSDTFGSRSKSFSKFWSWNNLITYDKNFADHNLVFMLGHEMQESYFDNLSGSREGYLSNGVTDLDAGDASTALNSNNSNESTLVSYFGRLQYSFNNKYFLTGTIRRDGSSKFLGDNKWGWFPSAGLSWKISNENFLRDSNTISNLKLRLGWGKVGNQFVPAYQYTSLLSASPSIWGNGIIAVNTANPDLKWETTSSYDIGLDIDLFNDRVSIVTDVYLKETEDLLLEVPLPAYVGAGADNSGGNTRYPFANIGSLENRGFELTLNTKNIKTDQLEWDTNLTFAINKNEVTALNNQSSNVPGEVSIGGETSVITQTNVGEPIGQFYGYKVIGRFNEPTDFYYKDDQGNVIQTAIPENQEISLGSVWLGDYIYEDINGDGVINESDIVNIGSPHPDFTFGIGNNFRFNGWEFNIFLNGTYGNEVANFQRTYLENPNSNYNVLSQTLDYARLGLIDPNGPADDFRNVRVVGGDPQAYRIGRSQNDNDRFSDRYIEDGSHVRIRNISLGYNFPKTITEKIGLESLKLYTNSQNVFVFSKYSGFDPEVGAINQRATLSGIDNGRYPMPFILTFGLNAKF